MTKKVFTLINRATLRLNKNDGSIKVANGQRPFIAPVYCVDRSYRLKGWPSFQDEMYIINCVHKHQFRLYFHRNDIPNRLGASGKDDHTLKTIV